MAHAAQTQLLSQLHRSLGDGVEFEAACQLLEFLVKHSKTTYINLQLMRQITPGAAGGVYDSALLKALQVLAGDGVKILNLGFEFFDEEDQPHKLTSDEALAALEGEINPITGDPEPDVRKKVAIYFAPNYEAVNSLGQDFNLREVRH